MLIETKRFFGLEEQPLPNLVKIQGADTIGVLEEYALVMKKEVGEGPVVFWQGQGINAADACAKISREFFMHTDKKIQLTKQSIFALTDEHIEFGRREVINENGQRVMRSALWYVYGRTHTELTRKFEYQLRSKRKTKVLNDLANQSAEAVASKFIKVIRRAIA